MLKRPRRRATTLLGVGVFFFLFLTAFSSSAQTEAFASEHEEIQKAAQKYLEAEVQRNFTAIYESLAPSSEYVAAHSFETYLAEAQASPVRIVSYRILNIFQITNNLDKEKYPKIDRSAQVEVDVVIRYVDTQKESMVNYAFPFVKEGGKWYKL
ncbi:MAG: hypothetical protein ABSE95_10310 [Thermodesulfobacteriota bacterium]|jgi:hypothetical protein